MGHLGWQCRPETCGGIHYDPCEVAGGGQVVKGFSSLSHDERAMVVDAYRRTVTEGYATLFGCVGQIIAERGTCCAWMDEHGVTS